MVSFPPTLQALAVLCWTKLLLPQQQVVLLSLKAPSFLQLRQLFGRFLVLGGNCISSCLAGLLLSRSVSRGASFSFKHRFTLFRRRAIHAASETGFLVRALAGKVCKANSGKLKKAMCRQASCRLASSRRPETNLGLRADPDDLSEPKPSCQIFWASIATAPRRLFLSHWRSRLSNALK